MNNDIYLIGEVGWDITLQSVIDMVEQSDKNKPLNVHIHSQGGGVYDGLAIYNYLKNLKQEVHTKSSGLVASIASIIFLAGKKETRTINSTDNFLIHLPSGANWGNAEDLEKTAEELRSIEDKLATIYENETDISKEEALEWMKDDKFLDVNVLKEKGFVNDIIEFKAVASLGNKNNNKNMSEQLSKKDAESLFDKLNEKFENFMNKVMPSNEEAPNNKVVQDATGTEIDFFNIKANDKITVDLEAKIDGKNANGDYVMPSGETYKFENGILKAIEPKSDVNEELENLKAELKDKTEAFETLKNEKETLESQFNEIKNDLTDLKGQITSKFEHENKVENKVEDKPTKRTFLKE